jgi:hypothetical protein
MPQSNSGITNRTHESISLFDLDINLYDLPISSSSFDNLESLRYGRS